MRLIKYLSITVMLIISLSVFGQADSTSTYKKRFPAGKLTIEPGIGINPYPKSDIGVSNLIQYNIKKRLSLLSRTSFLFNNAFERNFNYIKTNYNNSISQTFGIGTSAYTRHSSHTFSLMAGIKYDAFKETLDNPEYETVTVSVNSISPDVGLMYNLKIGNKKYFFSYRMYLPLFPYPVKGIDINFIDGNLANISLELGLGIRLK